jgi:purine-nucleoside phosphorylase
MSEPFDPRLKNMLESAIQKHNLPIHHGVYICSLGPTYESPAEAQYHRKNGGDLAGMSTALEVIAAKHGGMRVAGISLVTNMCCGNDINHNEVCEMGKKKAAHFINILEDFF